MFTWFWLFFCMKLSTQSVWEYVSIRKWMISLVLRKWNWALKMSYFYKDCNWFEHSKCLIYVFRLTKLFAYHLIWFFFFGLFVLIFVVSLFFVFGRSEKKELMNITKLCASKLYFMELFFFFILLSAFYFLFFMISFYVLVCRFARWYVFWSMFL